MTPEGTPVRELSEAAASRLAAELSAALKRRPEDEAAVAGVLHVLVPYSEPLREAAAAALDYLFRRGAQDRPLYAACLRALVECRDPRVIGVLSKALALEDGGGLGCLAAAALLDAPELTESLARLATVRSPQTAFAAELARVARGESEGQLLVQVAPRIKESHRVELCERMLLAMIWGRRPCPGAGPALAILRDQERHLGRWLLFAELASLSGDRGPAEQARSLASDGPSSSRLGWTLLSWALSPGVSLPTLRPTLEVLARLSDRPSAERDLTFVFRLADARLPQLRPLLEGLVKEGVLDDSRAVRAAGFLLRDHGREDLGRRLVELVKSQRREPLRGLALAVLADAQPALLDGLSVELTRSRKLRCVGWALLVEQSRLAGPGHPVIDEPRYRRLELGWLD